MSSGTGRRRAALALAAPAVLALALPAADLHDHPDRPETECRICQVPTAPDAVVRDTGALSEWVDLPGLRVAEAFPEGASPVLRTHGARAPPA